MIEVALFDSSENFSMLKVKLLYIIKYEWINFIYTFKLIDYLFIQLFWFS